MLDRPREDPGLGIAAELRSLLISSAEGLASCRNIFVAGVPVGVPLSSSAAQPTASRAMVRAEAATATARFFRVDFTKMSLP
jgi:hypothetical protein